jgi:hypothetical protein
MCSSFKGVKIEKFKIIIKQYLNLFFYEEKIDLPLIFIDLHSDVCIF